MISFKDTLTQNMDHNFLHILFYVGLQIPSFSKAFGTTLIWEFNVNFC